MHNEEINLIAIVKIVVKFIKTYRIIFLTSFIFGVLFGIYKMKTFKTEKVYNAKYYFQSNVVGEDFLAILIDEIPRKIKNKGWNDTLKVAKDNVFLSSLKDLTVEYKSSNNKEDDYVLVEAKSKNCSELNYIPQLISSYIQSNNQLELREKAYKDYIAQLELQKSNYDFLLNEKSSYKNKNNLLFEYRLKVILKIEADEKYFNLTKNLNPNLICHCFDKIVTEDFVKSGEVEDGSINSNLNVYLFRYTFLFLSLAILFALLRELYKLFKKYYNSYS